MTKATRAPAPPDTPTMYDVTVERIRESLDDHRPIREKKMFGALCFMVREKMAVCVQPDGGLLVRVNPQRSEELLARPGASQAEMGAGRSMGTSWISVAALGAATQEAVHSWVDVALENNAALLDGDSATS